MSKYYREIPRTEKFSARRYECLTTAATTDDRNNFILRSHQAQVTNHCQKVAKDPRSNQRGMLLYHSLGLGKTCSAINIANTLLTVYPKKYQKAIFITPAILRLNFVREYCGKCGGGVVKGDRSSNIRFRDLYEFYAYNDPTIAERLPVDFKNAVIIIDETHNLINGKRNGSRNRAAIFDLIANSTDCFVVALSGTPIYGNSYEFYLLQTLLYRQNPLADKATNQPLKAEAFSNLIDESPEQVIQAYQGSVSYVEPGDRADYPEIARDVYVFVPMTSEQYVEYKINVDKEDAIKKLPKCKLKDASAGGIIKQINGQDGSNEGAVTSNTGICYLARIKFFSSRICNLVYPAKKQTLLNLPMKFRQEFSNLNEMVDYYYGSDLWLGDGEQASSTSMRFDSLVKLNRDFDSVNLPNYDVNQLKQLSLQDYEKLKNSSLYSSEGDQYLLDREVFDNDPSLIYNDLELSNFTQLRLERDQQQTVIAMMTREALQTKYSPKFAAMLDRIIGSVGKHAVFSHFKTNYGVYFLSALLNFHGVSNIVYTGDYDENKKAKLLEQFNSPSNLNGDEYKVILITDAATEGLSIMATEYIHILTPKIIQNRINQVIGRIRRLGSHVKLPADRRKVTIYRYLTTFREADFWTERPSVSDRDYERELEDFEEYLESYLNFTSDQILDEDDDDDDDQKTVKYSDDGYVVSIAVSSDIYNTYLATYREYGIQKTLKVIRESAFESTLKKKGKISREMDPLEDLI